MNINNDDPKLTAFALGELSGDQEQQVRQAVEASPELQKEVQAIRSAAAALKAELADEPPVPLAPAQLAALAAAARKEKDAKPAKPQRRLLRLWVPLSAAAAALFIGAIFLPHLSGDRELAKQAQNRAMVPDAALLRDTGWAYEGRKRIDQDLNEGLKIGSGTLSGRSEPAANEGKFKLSEVTSDDLCLEIIPGHNTEAYDQIVTNEFLSPAGNPLSTFSIDVDTASYSNVRRFLRQNQLPPAGAVRVEEMINYFSYSYPTPSDKHPFSANVEVVDCPWQAGHKLVRIGLKGRQIAQDKRPPSNLVFLLDVSGSMNEPNKLPLVKAAMKMLVERLGENDRVAIAVYAGSEGLVLPPTRCDRKEAVLEALDRLSAGGSTNGGAGIKLAYSIAANPDNFIKGGVNRVILCTDGDFNVGVTNQSELIDLIEKNAKTGVFLSVLGFGMGNYKDSNLEKLADKGNGNYAYIDTINEARKALVEQMSGTLITIAKDVKIQVEFNPTKVAAYRLIGYENRMLKKEDFNDDTKDAGEIGAGHTVTALYQVVPVGVHIDLPKVDDLKYAASTSVPAVTDELLTVKLRYKQPDGDTSILMEHLVAGESVAFDRASEDMRFACAVASFGMILRDSKYKGSYTLEAVLDTAQSAKGKDTEGYRAEFLELVKIAKGLPKQQ